MNKKLATVLAATCVLGATSAFAANPFSDVQPSDWAYQAVEQLADEGIIIGYPDGTFGGERNITRYEMAQMVARAMAHEDMANAEQQAQINRLANEFADELNSLGVRVTNLENRLGNVRLTGSARVKYQKDSYDRFDRKANKAVVGDDNVSARLRLNFDAKVADSTSVFAQLETNVGLDKSIDNDGQIKVNDLYVHHDFGGVALQGGRYDVTLGATGFFYDDKFDGVTATFGDKFQLEAGYGKIKAANELIDGLYAGEAPKAWYAQVGTSFTEDLTAKAFYLDLESIKDGKEEMSFAFWGAGLNFNLNDSIQLRGDYVQNTKSYEGVADKPQFWTAGLLFGAADTQKVGSFEIGADYVSAERFSHIGGSGLNITAPLDLVDFQFAEKVNYWQASASVVPFENTLLKGYYAFDVEAKTGDKKYDGDNLWGVELNYYF